MNKTQSQKGAPSALPVFRAMRPIGRLLAAAALLVETACAIPTGGGGTLYVFKRPPETPAAVAPQQPAPSSAQIEAPPKPIEAFDPKLAAMLLPVANVLQTNEPIGVRLNKAFIELGNLSDSPEVAALERRDRMKVVWMAVHLFDILGNLSRSRIAVGKENEIAWDEVAVVQGRAIAPLTPFGERLDYRSLNALREAKEFFERELEIYKTDPDFQPLAQFFQQAKGVLEEDSVPPKPVPRVAEGSSPYAALLNALIQIEEDMSAIKEAQRVPTKHPMLGKPFSFELFSDENINPNLSQKRVQIRPPFDTPVVINQWDDWCKPCIAEMPELDRLHRSGVATVIGYSSGLWTRNGPSERGIREDRQHLEEMMEREDIPRVSYPLAVSRDDAFEAIGNGFPMSVILDHQGIVRKIIRRRTTEAELRRSIEGL